MSKYTPGPWHQGGIESKDKHWMRDVRGLNNSSVAWCGSFPENEAHANARLIAAAPDLLEALQSCLDYGSMTGDEWVKEKAIAAIKKATE
jgi:hypothetical protein